MRPFLNIKVSKCADDDCGYSCKLQGGKYEPEFSTKRVGEGIEVDCLTHTSKMQGMLQRLEDSIGLIDAQPKPEDDPSKRESVRELAGIKEDRSSAAVSTPVLEDSPVIRTESKGVDGGSEAQAEEGFDAIAHNILIDFDPFNQYQYDGVLKSSMDIIKHYSMNRPRIISIDFDGVIHKHVYTPDLSTWNDFYYPMPGAREAIKTLTDSGFMVVVNTLRPNPHYVIKWLFQHLIPVHAVNGTTRRFPFVSDWSTINPPVFCSYMKPIADVFIDDCNVEYLGLVHDKAPDYPWILAIEKIKKQYPNHPWR